MKDGLRLPSKGEGRLSVFATRSSFPSNLRRQKQNSPDAVSGELPRLLFFLLITILHCVASLKGVRE